MGVGYARAPRGETAAVHIWCARVYDIIIIFYRDKSVGRRSPPAGPHAFSATQYHDIYLLYTYICVCVCVNVLMYTYIWTRGAQVSVIAARHYYYYYCYYCYYIHFPTFGVIFFSSFTAALILSLSRNK